LFGRKISYAELGAYRQQATDSIKIGAGLENELRAGEWPSAAFGIVVQEDPAGSADSQLRRHSLPREQARAWRTAQRLESGHDICDAAIAEIFHALTPDHGERGVAYERFQSEQPPLFELLLERDELEIDHVPSMLAASDPSPAARLRIRT
jgi:hypothetical protein